MTIDASIIHCYYSVILCVLLLCVCELLFIIDTLRTGISIFNAY